MLRRGIIMLLTVLCWSFHVHGARSYRPKGVNVREKAKQLVTLLKDEERLREERIHALKTKEKMAQTSSGEADHYHEPLQHAATAGRLKPSTLLVLGHLVGALSLVRLGTIKADTDGATTAQTSKVQHNKVLNEWICVRGAISYGSSSDPYDMDPKISR